MEGADGVSSTPLQTAKGVQTRQVAGTAVGCAVLPARARAPQLLPERSGPLSPRLPAPPLRVSRHQLIFPFSLARSRQTASRRPASDSERRAAGPRAAQPRTREGLLPPASCQPSPRRAQPGPATGAKPEAGKGTALPSSRLALPRDPGTAGSLPSPQNRACRDWGLGNLEIVLHKCGSSSGNFRFRGLEDSGQRWQVWKEGAKWQSAGRGRHSAGP